MKLEEQLSEYALSGRYPFHMPGHKRQSVDTYPEFLNICQSIDITEITDFDDLHAPEGVILALKDEMTEFYGTDSTYMIVGGSTAGVITAISACTDIGGEILIARNCHKSVINICMARDILPRYVCGENVGKSGIIGEISAEDVDKALNKYKNIQAVVIVSPTYEGVISDIKEITSVAHKHGVPLIVDEAHGAHLYYSRNGKFGQSAVGIADIVIQSMHKTLPALTQTALLHVKSDIVNIEKLLRFYHTYQTSSPSYILMSDMSACFHYLSSHMEIMDCYYEKVMALREKLAELKNIHLLSDKDVCNENKDSCVALDPGKLVLMPEPGFMTGRELFTVLRDTYCLELEMSSPKYCIAMTSVCDTEDGFDRLFDALKMIDSEHGELINNKEINTAKEAEHIPEQVISPYKAVEAEYELFPVDEAVGRISADNLYIYPPGAAFIVAGERFDRETVEKIYEYKKAGFEIKGMKDGKIKAVRTHS